MLVLCAQHAAAGFIVRILELGAFRPEFGARQRKRGYEFGVDLRRASESCALLCR
jgi:hypothetical protein